MKQQHAAKVATGVFAALAVGFVFALGAIAGRPAPVSVELVKTSQAATLATCQAGLAQLGFQLPIITPERVEAFKPVGGSPREGALELALALQFCPQFEVAQSCVGTACNQPQTGIALSLVAPAVE